MLISVKVFPGASRDAVMPEGARLRVFVRAPAQDNQANKAVVRVVAEYFDCKSEEVRIMKGHRSMNKILEIPEEHNRGIKEV
jgi:uncharacterized protein (TIGR00251 family)